LTEEQLKIGWIIGLVYWSMVFGALLVLAVASLLDWWSKRHKKEGSR
jgi:hypothetical protein